MPVKEQKITIFGFGSQGRAQALNARDSGWKVEIFLRPGSERIAEASREKFSIITDPVLAARQADIALLLIPDRAQPEFWSTVLKPNLPRGGSLIFAHGFNIHFKTIGKRPDIDYLLVAPALQGDALREHYLNREPVAILTAVEQDFSDQSYRRVEDLAKAIGGEKTKIIPSTFKEETETDLFSEQAVLCGGVPALIEAGLATLVEAGYNPEIATYSCLKELKAMVDIIYREGLEALQKKISDTARYGALTRGPRIINKETRRILEEILEEICSGKFARELLEEKKNG